MMLYGLKNLKMAYDDKTVLDIPNLEIEQGTIHGLLGPNGSGKTTLLSILAFLEIPTWGNLYYKGNPVIFSEKNLKALRREVVLVDQHPIMFSTTVYKNVEFGLKVRKIDKKKRQKIVLDALDRVGLKNFASAKATNLSGGEIQRVAIARGLACSPKVMLLDEPTSSVDMENQITIENIIKELNCDGKISVILSTHDLFQATRLTKRKIFMYEGRITGSSYENIFSGTGVLIDGEEYCLIDNRILVPLKGLKKGKNRISIKPGKVKIYKDKNQSMKAGRFFKGRIIRMSDENSKIRILVDIGIPVNILISQEEYEKLNILIGAKVMIEISGDAIDIIPNG